MKIRLLNFLSCPFCGGFFRLHSFLARNDFETCVTNIKCCERFCGLKNRLVTFTLRSVGPRGFGMYGGSYLKHIEGRGD